MQQGVTCASPVSSAVESGSQMLELDCHLTLDGHVVVSHDENLLRQTGQDANISSLKLQVRAGIQPGLWRTPAQSLMLITPLSQIFGLNQIPPSIVAYASCI